MLAGDKAVSSFDIRSAIPGYIVVPPDNTTLPYLSDHFGVRYGERG